jgi:hypothetical protein
VFWFEDEKVCSFVVRDKKALKSYFKDPTRGLLEIYPHLDPGGAGGRPNIGGSSRAEQAEWEDALSFGEQIEQLLSNQLK